MALGLWPRLFTQRASEGSHLRKAIAACLLFFVGCGGGDESYATVKEVVDALKEGGVKCTRMRIDDDHDEALGVIESGACDIGDEPLYIVIAGGEDELESLLDADDVPGAAFVVGDVWTVGAAEEAIAENVQEAIGGELEK